MAHACLLLPPRERFAGEALPQALARAFGRADRFDAPPPMEALFEVLPRGWPAAAVSRQAESGDAGGALWLRADPGYARADINGARLLAVGEMLALDAATAEALLAPLRPLFGDVGMPMEAGSPSAWYLRLQPGSPLPAFVPADEALGADLYDVLPKGPEGRRWRALLSEAQVLLHQNPVNAARQERGLAPVNSLCFWGAGRLPDRVRSGFRTIHSPDSTVRAFATFAGAQAASAQPWSTPDVDTAHDLRHERSLERLCALWLEPAVAGLARRALDRLSLVWADGMRLELRRSQALRFWRRPLRVLAEPETA